MMWQDGIERHYREIWDAPFEVCNFTTGPIRDLPDAFAILKFPPHKSRTMWTYATRCMSQPQDEVALELHIFSPQETEEIIEILVATAHFHRTSSRLNIGHSVNFGRPWIDGSNCDRGLISLPYLDGPRLERAQIAFKNINFLWMIPVTAEEVKYKNEAGLEALEVAFDRSGFDYANPSRESVV